jgi:hypothetical protein
LILDYHLDGNGDDGPCREALEAIEHLASTPHFNLVVIYTNGYKGNINKVFMDIVCSLQNLPNIREIPASLSKKIDEELDKWSLEEDGIQKILEDSIVDLDFLYLLMEFGVDPKKWTDDSPYLSELKLIYDKKPKDIKLPFSVFKWWTINRKILSLKSCFGKKDFLNFGWGIADEVNWIHTDQLFITIIGKSNPPETIPQKLLQALTKWQPHPHKLILTKLRHVIDEKGIAFTNNILSKQYVHAYWLENILKADDEAIDFKAWNILCKHWDELATQSKRDLLEFNLRMISQLKKSGDIEEICKKFTKPEVLLEPYQILAHANCFNCSKPIEGYHLTTGHVLELNENGAISYWVCVTPACDLVPGQKDGSLKDKIPITLQRLFDGNSACRTADETGKLKNEDIFKRTLEKATSKKILFLTFEGSPDVCIFSSIVNIYGDANPRLKDFYVQNAGKFNLADRNLTLFKTDLDDKEHLIFKKVEATIVAQLRYEYALDLLLKTGRCKSRIGLDFIGPPN